MTPDLTDEWRERSYKGSALERWHAAQRIDRKAREAERVALAPMYAAFAAEHKAASPARRMALVRFHAAKRRTARLQRSPAWADQAAIRAIYEEAHRLTAESGVAHHVDHVIPLQGARVSGLHVHNNLQILTGSENSRKHNHFEPC